MIHYNQIAGQKIQRIEALSDGVFSIALTLLVLDMKVPLNLGFKNESELIVGLTGLLPKLLSYFLSFLTIGIFWTGHSAQFHFIEKSNRNFQWINLFFLLFVSMLPFTTAYLSEYIHFKIAVGLYWLNIFLLGASLYLNWKYALKKGFLTLNDSKQDSLNEITMAIKKRIIIAQALYAIGAALCFVNTYLSISFIIIVQLNYVFGLVQLKHKPK